MEKAVSLGLANRTEARESEIDVALSEINLTQVDADREISAALSAYYDFTGRSDSDLAYNTGTMDLFDSSWDDLERRPGNRGVTLTVDIPIWDWGVNKAEVEERESEPPAH